MSILTPARRRKHVLATYPTLFTTRIRRRQTRHGVRVSVHLCIRPEHDEADRPLSRAEVCELAKEALRKLGGEP